jgi:hypothetical protein
MVWFLKRKSVPAHAQEAFVSRVIVSRSDFSAEEDPGRLVNAVVKFVNAMNDQGAWRADELPVEAQQVYASDYYLAQVNNGGHAQFIWNGRSYLDKNCQLATGAFWAMRAPDHLAIMDDLVAWLKLVGEQAFDQTGLVGSGQRAPALDALDERFLSVQRTSPMTARSADWIRTWDCLTVAEDAAYPTAISEVAAQNPRQASRREIRALFPIISRTTQHMEIGFGLALSNLPVSAILSSIQPGRFTELGGEDLPVFRLLTTAGEFQGVASTLGVAVYPGQEARKGLGLPSLPTDSEKPLSMVPTQVIEALAKLSAQSNAGVAINFLLKDCFADASYLALGAQGVNVHRAPHHTEWRVAATGKTLVAIVSESDASLLDERGKVLKRISSQAVTERFKAMSA